MIRQDRLSVQRRRVLKIGGAGMLAAAAGVAAATETGAPSGRHPFLAGDTLVLSGCLRGPDGQPLGGLALALRGAGGMLAHGTSDGAGRFVLRTRLPALADTLAVEVAHAAPQVVSLRRNARKDAHLDRDIDGTWRASVSITFA